MGKFKEELHPRDANGEFTDSGGGDGTWLDKLNGKIASDLGELASGSEVENVTPDSVEYLPRGTKESHAVQVYTGGEYTAINRRLRKGREPHPLTGDIDNAFDSAPPLSRPIEIYRGTHDPEDLFGEPGEHVGDTFQDLGFISTSYNKSRVDRGYEAVLKIIVPKGQKVIRPSSNGQYGDKEGEIILQRGTRFKIVSDKMGADGKRYLEMEVLP